MYVCLCICVYVCPCMYVYICIYTLALANQHKIEMLGTDNGNADTFHKNNHSEWVALFMLEMNFICCLLIAVIDECQYSCNYWCQLSLFIISKLLAISNCN